MKIRSLAAIVGTTALAVVGLSPTAGADTRLGLHVTPTQGVGSLNVHVTTARTCDRQDDVVEYDNDDEYQPNEVVLRAPRSSVGHVGYYEELPNVLLSFQEFSGTLDDYFTFTKPGIYSVQVFCPATESSPAYNERVKVQVFEPPVTTTTESPTTTVAPTTMVAPTTTAPTTTAPTTTSPTTTPTSSVARVESATVTNTEAVAASQAVAAPKVAATSVSYTG